MSRVLFLASHPLEVEAIEKLIQGIGEGLSFSNEKEGSFFLNERGVSSLLKRISGDPASYSEISFLQYEKEDGFAEKLLHRALDFFPGALIFPSDVILKEMSFGDYSSLPFLSALFRDLPEDLLLSAKKYLECGLDGLLAADALYIHRNTFHYRLDQFRKRTSLDLHEYHNAVLFELYWHLIRKDFS